ncbi:biopolymer transporter ExbD [bacterium]|nr:biopolymer transporter ExbD [bacterium]
MAFIPSHKKRPRENPGQARLQLTSMMDMFTIILVFLLKIYSTHGQLINPSEDLTLPSSKVQQLPELGLDVTVSSDWILVNGKPVEQTQNIIEQEGYIIPRLQEELLRYSTEAEKMEILYGAEFSGKATIQGDKHLPYRLLIKVMATCGQSNFPNMRLVVYREE